MVQRENISKGQASSAHFSARYRRYPHETSPQHDDEEHILPRLTP